MYDDEQDSRLPNFSPQSSNVVYVQYDPGSRELLIEFKFSGVYVYSDVPVDVFVAFRNAPSAGKFVHQNIKDVYNFQQTGFSSR